VVPQHDFFSHAVADATSNLDRQRVLWETRPDRITTGAIDR
jgi:hypothetical protein